MSHEYSELYDRCRYRNNQHQGRPFKENGEVVAKAGGEYPAPPYSPTAEQDPEQIFQTVISSVQGVMTESGIDPAQVLFVSFSAAMHSVIAVDSQGAPLTRRITWADNRSVSLVCEVKRTRRHGAVPRTGTPIHPMSPVTKLMWMRHESPSSLIMPKFISIKEYVYFKLFGQYIVDHSIASSTGMMNLEELAWDQQALELAGITEDHLSRIVPTTHISGRPEKRGMPRPWGSPLPHLRAWSRRRPVEPRRECHQAGSRCRYHRYERCDPYGCRQADDRSEGSYFLLRINGEALGNRRRG